MTEEYVTYQQAQDLYTLGFPAKTIGISGLETIPCSYLSPPEGCRAWANNTGIEHPTQSLVHKWLRDEKNIYIVILPCIKDVMGDLSKADYFEYRVVKDGAEPYIGSKDTYEDAMSEAIDKCIELLKAEI